MRIWRGCNRDYAAFSAVAADSCVCAAGIAGIARLGVLADCEAVMNEPVLSSKTHGGTTYAVLPHPFSKEHTLFKVTSRGHVWAAVGADTDTQPTPETVQYLWKHERQEFLPYDESTNKPDLWHTFNRIQENSLKGVRTRDDRWHRVTSRAVKGIDGDVKLNRALWSLAEKFAELKRAA
jgi:hypothetical protein